MQTALADELQKKQVTRGHLRSPGVTGILGGAGRIRIRSPADAPKRTGRKGENGGNTGDGEENQRQTRTTGTLTKWLTRQFTNRTVQRYHEQQIRMKNERKAAQAEEEESYRM